MDYSGLVIQSIALAVQSITTVVVALIGLSWYSQEKKRREMEKYEKLIEYLHYFYEPSADSEAEKEKKEKEYYIKRNEFIQQYRLSFMYGSDEVIKKLNFFFACMHTNTNHNDIEKNKAIGEIIMAIRNDVYNWPKFPLIKIFYKKSKLSIEDFKHIRSNDTSKNP